MIDFALSQNDGRTIINGDMGLGKTRAAIETLRRASARRILVVCPPKVIRVWNYQLGLWGSDWELFPLDQNGTASRVKALGSPDSGIVITNYQGFWREPLFTALRKWKPDTVVFDEVHRLKSAGSRQSVKAHTLAKAADMRLGLTGTFLTNGKTDVYGQARAIDDRIFGTSFAAFMGRYFIQITDPFPIIVAELNQPEFEAKLRSFVGVWENKGLIALPDVVETTFPIRLSAKTKKDYDTFKRDLVVENEHGILDAQNLLVRATRLRQLAAGIYPAATGDVLIDDSKMVAAQDWVEDTSEPVVIWTVFQLEQDELYARLVKAGHGVSRCSGRVDELDDWLAGRTRVLIINFSVGAEGLDFTRARHNLFMSPTFNALDFWQAQARTRRPGADVTQKVTYTYLVAEGTIDAKVYAALKEKRSVEDTIRRALQ